MKKYILQIVMLMLVIISSCNVANKKEEGNDIDINNPNAKEVSSIKEEKKHWGYIGETSPEHWAEIENSECGGKFQSPINIVKTKKDTNLSPLDIHYSDETKIHDIINNGHSIQFDFEPGDYIKIDKERYDLKQFHFHEAAEHTIKGVRYPLVIHMVHMNKDGKYAVIAILGQESDENSDPFEFLDEYLPVKLNETKEINEEFNMDDVLPNNKAYYTYEGSLTTPPCTEGVKWFILKEPVEVTKKLVDDLKKLMPLNNYRDVQPINDRIIKESN